MRALYPTYVALIYIILHYFHNILQASFLLCTRRSENLPKRWW